MMTLFIMMLLLFRQKTLNVIITAFSLVFKGLPWMVKTLDRTVAEVFNIPPLMNDEDTLY